MNRAGNQKLAAIVRNWEWLSDNASRPPACATHIDSLRFSFLTTNEGVSHFEMASLLRRASIRLGLSPLRHDLFVPPNSRVAVHLTPKVFAERVSINFQRLAAIPTWRTGKWIDSSPNSFLDFQPLKAFSDYFLVVDKPAAVPSIEPADCPESALTPHWLRRVLPRHLSQGYLSVTGRLDAGTHGVMVVSRSAEYTGLFNKVIQARNLTKKYVAVVHGWNSVANARHKRGKWTHFYRKRSDFAQENDLFMHLAPGDATIAEYESDFSKMRFVASAAQDLQHTVPVQLEVTAAREVTSSSVALRCFHPLTVDRVRIAHDHCDGVVSLMCL